MPDERIYVVTYFHVKPAHVEQGIRLMRDSRNPTSVLLQEISRPNRFVIVESLQDQRALADHETAAATLGFREQVREIHSSPDDRRVHTGFVVDAEPLSGAAGLYAVVTHVDVPPPRRDEAEVLVRGLAEESRKDAGNIRYDIYQQLAPRLNHFTVFALWKDQSYFDAHEQTSHRLKTREALWPILGAPYDERLFASI